MHKLKQALVTATPWAALFVALFVIPGLNLWQVPDTEGKLAPFLGIETVNQLGRFLCYAIVAIGIDLIWGYTGILSLCQAMFFCLGGYCIGMHLALHGPLGGDFKDVPRCLYVVTSDVKGFGLPFFWKPFDSFPMALLLVMLVPGVIAFVFGYFAFRSRVKGVYFSIITQALTLGACLVIRQNNLRLCGTNGLNFFKEKTADGAEITTTLLGYDISSERTKLGLYIVTVLVLCAVYLAARWLMNSRLGRILIAVRDNESRLRFSGYQPLYFKLFIFTLSAMIAGIAGMLYTPQTGIVTPFNMEPEKSIIMVVWVAIGGRASLSGAIVGAVVINYAYAVLTSGTIYKWLIATSPYHWLTDTSIYQWVFPHGQAINDATGFTWLARAALQKLGALPELLFGPAGWQFVLGILCIGVVLYFPNGMIGFWRKLTRTGSNTEEQRPVPSLTAAVIGAESGKPATEAHV